MALMISAALLMAWREAGLDLVADGRRDDITNGQYETSVTDTGRLAWSDGTKPPDNNAHHPEELLRGDTDPPEERDD
jgi:hypothetical protein